MYLLNGVVILLPIAGTIWVIRFLVVMLNNTILEPLLHLFSFTSDEIKSVHIAKTVIFFIVLAAVALIGWGAKVLFVKRLFAFGENILLKVPFMGRLYKALKQIFSALLGEGKTVFKQVVFIEYPRKGLYTIGFTTGTTKGELRDSIEGSGVNVFVPTTPNPTSGFFLIVPKESIRFLKMSVEDGMKLVVSGGSVSPPGEGGEA